MGNCMGATMPLNFQQVKDVELLLKDMKSCGSLRTKLEKKLKKVEAQLNQVLLQMAANPSYGPAEKELKDALVIIMDEIEQQLGEIKSHEFLV
jgi:molybdopterin converting factor small subunit